MTNSSLKPEQRILQTATKLFYANGINAVGVDTISEQAKVSKRTLYKYFPTKDALAAAYLEHQTENWLASYVSDDVSEPEQRIRRIFSSLQKESESSGFCGCPFMNVAVELRSGTCDASRAAGEGKRSLYDFFAHECTRLGITDPKQVAEQLVVLFDGANAWIIVHRAFPTSTFGTLDVILRATA